MKKRIIEALKRRPMGWSDLLEYASVSKGALSTHLNELIKGGVLTTVVDSERRPPSTIYRLNTDKLTEQRVISFKSLLLQEEPTTTQISILTSEIKDIVQKKEKEKIALAKKDPGARELLLQEIVLATVMDGSTIYFVSEEGGRWEPYAGETAAYPSAEEARKKWIKEKVSSIEDYLKEIYEIPFEREEVEEMINDLFERGLIRFGNKNLFGPLYSEKVKDLLESLSRKYKGKFGSDPMLKKL